ncbi:MAG: 23S rRNA (pseudouridine(1915)-N(3))-methyltransferase RlmH [Bacteroidetes bacterium]|nr:23S rRNA (pseudouridine(1915)-N(3))-methyltransferase RlmH [Bacteroidota bacterium]
MKIHFWSVGKAHESYVKEGTMLFTKRIAHYFPIQWKIIPSAKEDVKNAENIKMEEGKKILSLLSTDDILIALDENGKQFSSPQLAELIQKKANESTRNLIFLIGGAYGIHETVLNRSNIKWSLSHLVFPHQLVRLVLAEQIYRACTILRNEKYHHS